MDKKNPIKMRGCTNIIEFNSDLPVKKVKNKKCKYYSYSYMLKITVTEQGY